MLIFKWISGWEGLVRVIVILIFDVGDVVFFFLVNRVGEIIDVVWRYVEVVFCFVGGYFVFVYDGVEFKNGLKIWIKCNFKD